MNKKKVIGAAVTCVLAASIVLPLTINKTKDVSTVKADEIDDAKNEDDVKKETKEAEKETKEKVDNIKLKAQPSIAEGLYRGTKIVEISPGVFEEQPVDQDQIDIKDAADYEGVAEPKPEPEKGPIIGPDGYPVTGLDEDPVTGPDEDMELKTSENEPLEEDDETENFDVYRSEPVIHSDSVISCWPCPSSTYITSYYGPRSCYEPYHVTWHTGLDIYAEEGDSIVAAGDGYVVSCGYSDIRGYYVLIDHGNGLNTLYQHMSGFAVSTGDNVSAGQTIGYAGSTGIVTGAHLHFEVWEDGETVDPIKYYN